MNDETKAYIKMNEAKIKAAKLLADAHKEAKEWLELAGADSDDELQTIWDAITA